MEKKVRKDILKEPDVCLCNTFKNASFVKQVSESHIQQVNHFAQLNFTVQ